MNTPSATTVMPISAQHPILPPEIQLNILEWLTKSHRNPDESKPCLSIYACVCKGWQSSVEQELFRHLTLHPSDVECFARYARPHRRGYIKHILLEICIKESTDRRPDDLGLTSSGDCNIFTLAVWNLWQALSTWNNHRLTVELGIVSSFEKQQASVHLEEIYWSTPWSLTQAPPENASTIPHIEHLTTFHHPPTDRILFARWIQQRWGLLGFLLVELRLGSVLPRDFQGTRCLPKVEVIARLLIRRQYFRRIKPRTLAEIVASIPCIEVIHLERWRSALVITDSRWDEETGDFLHALSPSLKRFSFFEECSTPYHQLWRGMTFPRSNRRLLNSLTQTGRHLEHISISFSIDAQSFFSPHQQLDFGLLTTLALTSEAMTSRSASMVSELLRNAARAAKGIPKLELLELWDYEAGQTGIFVYEKLDRCSQVTWQGTWDFKIPKEVEDKWREVFTDPDGDLYQLHVKHVTLQPGQVTSLGSIFPYLKLREHILHAVTWTQV